MLESKPELPIRVASLGRVYRNEAVDATHLAMFHQFEGIWVDRGLGFHHLKGTLAFIARALFDGLAPAVCEMRRLMVEARRGLPTSAP